MKYDLTTYKEIRKSCKAKEEIIFEADKAITVFARVEAPAKWAIFKPNNDQIANASTSEMYYSGSGIENELIRLEYYVWATGGEISYKQGENNSVLFSVKW